MANSSGGTQRLTIWRKIAYGAGDSGFSLTSTALALLYLFFLVNVVGLDPAAAGISIGIGRIWDALNDLFVGTLSDRTRSRWGRRRPYLLFGAIPLGFAFVLMWLVPPTDQQTLLLIYYTAMYILFDTLFTLTNVPYIALTPEIAPTYDERTSLHSYRMAFSIGFGLIGAIAPLAIVDAIAGSNPTTSELRSAYTAMAVILGLFSIFPIYIAFFAVRENPEYQLLPTPSLRQSFRIAAANKAFLIAIGIHLLTWIPIDLIQFVLVFLLSDYFGLSNDEVNIVFGLLFGTAILALPLWVWVSGRWNKNRAYQVGIAFLAIVLLVLSFAPPGYPALIVILSILAGIGLSAAHAIPLAMLPDTIEWDELRSSNRQEAAYYSVVTLIQKLIGAVTIALTGSLLTATGYIQTTDGSATQPQSAINAIRLLSGLLPAVIFVVGIVLSFFYPLTRERHARLVRAIEKKRALRQRFAEKSATK